MDWKIEKNAKEERIRQEIDKKEAEMQQKRREDIIQRANHILFERNEKVKFLRSQQLYSDVIEEREQQMKEKKESDEKQILEEKKWHEECMRKILEEEKREKKKILIEKEKAKEIREMLKKQKEETETMKNQILEQQKLEYAQLLEKIAFDDMKTEQNAFLEKLERKKRNKEHMNKMKEDAKTDYEEKIRLEKLDAAQRDEIIFQKERTSHARAMLEKKHIKARQADTQGKIAEAYKELEKRSKKEIEIFLRDQKRADDNLKAALEKKIRERERQQLIIHESRQMQIKMRQDEKLFLKEEAELMAKQLKKQNIEEQEREALKQNNKQEKNYEVRNFLEKQCAENAEKKQIERREELSHSQKIKETLTLEDDQFKKLALREIESFRIHGKKSKNIAMLERAMNVKDVTLLPGIQS